MERNIKELDSQLLTITRHFLLEQEMKTAVRAISLTASFERDLGIDSLGKVELFHRIEKAFDVTFADTVLAEADTLIEVEKAILLTAPEKRNFYNFNTAVSGGEHVDIDLSKIKTLQEALIIYALHEPDRPHIYLQNEHGQEEVITYGDLYQKALDIASCLIVNGIKPDDKISIMLPTSAAFFQSFFGILFAGAIPVPIYPPYRPDRIEEYAIREAKILNNAEVRILITFSEAEKLSSILKSYVPSLKRVCTIKTLLGFESIIEKNKPPILRQSEDFALLQYTSGSTGDPKGILLQHKNILANIRAINEAISVRPTDKVVSWLPLYHDMGLFSWINSLYFGLPIAILSPITFLHRPERWLWTIHYHRGTITAAPNFAYELCIKKIDDEAISGLDLSSLRLCCNGAEAVNPKTIRRFYERFKQYGFKNTASFPVYGLAENTVALATPPLNRPPRFDRILREPLEKELRAITTQDEKNSREFVSEGKAIPNHEIRIVDAEERILEERFIGEVQFRGPSAMHGFFNNPTATEKAYHNGWWDTGDLGYIADGELFITGRKKDVIIKAGRNLYPEMIEEVVGYIDGVRKGCVIAFGVFDSESGTEKMIVIAESKTQEKSEINKLTNKIIEQIDLGIGIPPDQVIIVRPNQIPKTSSGKLQRGECKDLYLKGILFKKQKKVSFQITKLYLSAFFKKTKQWTLKLFRAIYTFYVFTIFIITFFPVWLFVLLSSRTVAVKIIRIWARLLFFFMFCPLKVAGREYLSTNQEMIFAANHASYIDPFALITLMPTNTIFIVKKELMKLPMIGRVMKKLNYITVDRWEFAQNIEDTKRIQYELEQGQSILIFPEGTFTYATGLRPFKAGAFQLSVDSQKPICPIALKNTRRLLRDGSILFSPVEITITISEPIQPKATGWQEVIRLRKEVYKQISQHCGEPSVDLIAAGPER